MADDKKIIIDDDWKEEAQREKEALAAALEREKDHPRPVEAASFSLLLSGLATQALVALGEVPSPVTKKSDVNLGEAKFHIDLLEILEQKTQGNLTHDEGRLLSYLLYDLRMRYVGKPSAAAPGN